MSARELKLDFRRRPASAGRWYGWALLLAASVAAVAVAQAHAQLARQHADALEHHERLSERLRARTPKRVTSMPDPSTLAGIRSANGIIDQLTVPWEGLFDTVEAADARGLALLSLTPTARDRSVRLSGEVRSVPELLAYVQRLEAQSALGQVHLLGYSSVLRDGVKIVGFTISATWKGQP